MAISLSADHSVADRRSMFKSVMNGKLRHEGDVYGNALPTSDRQNLSVAETAPKVSSTIDWTLCSNASFAAISPSPLSQNSHRLELKPCPFHLAVRTELTDRRSCERDLDRGWWYECQRASFLTLDCLEDHGSLEAVA